MKTQLLVIALFCIKFADAQTPYEQVYQVDFLKLETQELKPQSYPRNKWGAVKIMNINRFIYKITSDKTETDFNVAVPAVLSAIKLPAFLSGQDADISVAAAPAPVSKNIGSDVSADLLRTQLNDRVKKLIYLRKKLNNAVAIHNDIVHTSKDCSNDFKTVRQEVKRKLNSILPGLPVLVTDTTSEPGEDVISISHYSDEMEKIMQADIQSANDEYAEI